MFLLDAMALVEDWKIHSISSALPYPINMSGLKFRSATQYQFKKLQGEKPLVWGVNTTRAPNSIFTENITGNSIAYNFTIGNCHHQEHEVLITKPLFIRISTPATQFRMLQLATYLHTHTRDPCNITKVILLPSHYSLVCKEWTFQTFNNDHLIKVYF